MVGSIWGPDLSMEAPRRVAAEVTSSVGGRYPEWAQRECRALKATSTSDASEERWLAVDGGGADGGGTG